MFNLKLCGLMATVVALSACTVLPRSGPSTESVVDSALAKSSSGEETLGYPYALVDVTTQILPFLSDDTQVPPASFGVANGSPPEIRLGVGDVVQVTVFESQAGGLFIPREAGVRPGNFVQLPPQEIGKNGVITIPYAGQVKAVGQRVEDLEETIRSRLEDQAIEPQISIEVVEKNAALASVVGSVGAPGSFVVRNSGDRILDMIARAGGVTSAEFNTVVTLTRRGVSASIPYEVLTSKASENIYVAPGDTLNITSDIKKFYVFGATGTVGEFDFNQADVFLRTALSFATGLLDDRAEPSDVLIYRQESRTVLSEIGLDISLFPQVSEDIATVYKVDFRKPDSFFIASEFPLQDGDVIYVSNAKSIEISKFFNLATTITGGTRSLEADITE
jgi:polysaccharide export outer membrane protein